MQTIEFGPHLPPEQTIDATAISVRLPAAPKRYYRHGWQSWSLAAWTDAAHPLPVAKPYLLHPMQHDPVYAFRRGHHGSWVGAVDAGPEHVLLLGALGLDAHVALESNELMGVYNAGSGPWFLAHGDEKAVFSKYAAELGKRLGGAPKRAVPRVWCSWYGLYTAIDQALLSRVFQGLGDLPFDVLQVDDGWQMAVGDWETNRKFPSGMEALARSIRSTGRRAGLWLAPLIAVRSSRLFRTHPDWFLMDRNGRLASAGFNWGEQLYALDTTHPDVIAWLGGLMRRVRAWGFDYIKLDFLYAGALPGQRRQDVPREAAYRAGLTVLREAMGDAYFVACGAPIIPSLGLCDALRVGPDVAPTWEGHRYAMLLHNPATPGTRNAIRTTLHRLWLQPLVQPDPDVVYFRSIECDLTPEQKDLLRSLALICGFKATSDLPQWLSEPERASLAAFLAATPHIEQAGARDFRVDGRDLDYRTAMELAHGPSGWEAVKSAGLAWLADHRWALRLDHELGKIALWRKRSRWE
jgi:alpha-galactosidase